MLRKCGWIICGIFWLLGSAPAKAQWYQNKWEITPFAGYETRGSYMLNPTSTTVNVTEVRANAAASFGTFVDYSVWESFQAEFMWDRNVTSYSELQPPSPTYVKAYNSDIDQFQFGGLYMFLGKEHKIRPYAAASIGFTHEFNSALPPTTGVTSGATPNRTDFGFGLGGGVKYQVTSHIGFRGDARYMPTYANSSLAQYCDPYYGCYTANAANYQHRGNFLAGIIFSF